MLLQLVRSHKLANGFLGGFVLNVCLEIGYQALATHVADDFLGGVEGTFVLVVLQQVLEDAAQHFRVNTNLGIVRVILVDGEVIGSKEVE